MPGKSVSSMPVTDPTATAGQNIVQGLLRGYTGPVAVRLWNGQLMDDRTDTDCTLHFREPSVLRHMVLRQDLVRLAESYLREEIDVEGDLESIFDFGEHVRRLHFSWPDKWRMLCQVLRLPRGQNTTLGTGKSTRRDNGRESIAHHYDVNNDFYRLWLDPEMVYSCAYFSHADESLADAQLNKLDYICRKLRLRPDQRLLDIGCGWGALALWAARKYGVRIHGITLSEEQYRYAQERVEQEGLSDLVRIELRDYRDLPDDAGYDRVVSVGMFEHIGVANFAQYFGTVKRVLKPQGLFLNHGITNDTGWRDTPLTRFMNQYVFPDGELERVSLVEDAMERAGFEIIDVEGLRRHYALTLRRWVQALEAQHELAVSLVGEATYRVWRLYMAGCAYYFDEGSINVYQILAGAVHQPLAVPLRRDDLYRNKCQGSNCKCDENG